MQYVMVPNLLRWIVNEDAHLLRFLVESACEKRTAADAKLLFQWLFTHRTTLVATRYGFDLFVDLLPVVLKSQIKTEAVQWSRALYVTFFFN